MKKFSKNQNKKLEEIRKKLDKLQFHLEEVEIQKTLEVKNLFDKFEENSEKIAKKINEKTEIKKENLKLQCDLLYEIDKVIKLKEKQLEQLKLKLEKQDLYLRKQYIQPQKKWFTRVIIILLIILTTVFLAILTPSIKKRIEYNPYVTDNKVMLDINDLIISHKNAMNDYVEDNK